MLKKKISICDLIFPFIISSILFFKVKSLYIQIGLGVYRYPLAFATAAFLFIIFALVSLINVKAAKITITVVYFVFCILFAVDGVYYTYVSKLPSVSLLGMVGQLDDISDMIGNLIKPKDILMIADIPLWILYLIFSRQIGKLVKKSPLSKAYEKLTNRFLPKIAAFCFGILATLVILVICLLYPGFKMEYLKNEMICYHVNDIAKNISKKVTPTVDDGFDKSAYVSPDWSDGEFWGLAEGRNVIIIQVEALQNFLINTYYEGQELTPVLNKMISEDTFYFNNYYYQVGGGNTSDAEFAVNNSLYGPDSNAAYMLYPDNTYHGLPYLLKDNGYSSAHVFHGYVREFWNREYAYPNQGFDDFISLENFDPTDSFNMGLSDRQLFKQSMNWIKTYKEPFYAFYITLSSHHPFGTPLDVREIKLKEEDEQTLFGLYLMATNYVDTCIGEFMDMLKEEGLYDNSVIVIYGDHYALNNTDHANVTKMNALLGRPYSLFDVFSVPLIIHVPGSGVTKTISTAGGHVDVLPTLLYLLGIKNDKAVMFGQNLIEAKEGFVPEQTHVAVGSFINDKVFFQRPFTDIETNYRVYLKDDLSLQDFHDYLDQMKRSEKIIEDCRHLLDTNNILLN